MVPATGLRHSGFHEVNASFDAVAEINRTLTILAEFKQYFNKLLAHFRDKPEVIPVRILVVQDNTDLGALWCAFLRRRGLSSTLAGNEEEALAALASDAYDALIIEPVLSGGGGLPVTDFATYRNPDIVIIAVTKSDFFSGGSIFSLIPNARGLLRTPVRPEDIAAYVEHFSDRRDTRAQVRESG
ncbi:MAG: hypothetical protein AAGE38_11485 [Pseudomonadota bacterium]